MATNLAKIHFLATKGSLHLRKSLIQVLTQSSFRITTRKMISMYME